MVTCCKDCTSRHYKCHATCKTYIGAVESHRKAIANKVASADGLNYDIERSIQINKRMGRRK